MPSTRITIASNANQSHKAPLLLPANLTNDPQFPHSSRAWIVKAAQSKLRLKNPSRFFVAGTGQELLLASDWQQHLTNDVVILASAGEDYVGATKSKAPLDSSAVSPTASTDRDRKEDEPDRQAPTCSISILAHLAPVDPLSLKQVETTATTLPGLIHAVAQPDLHPGTKFPIGAVFVSRRWIHPPLIGSDIGCGMAWYRTTLGRNQIEGDKGRRIAERLRGLEGPWRTQRERRIWLSMDISEGEAGDVLQGDFSAGETWDEALGTIGAGNHFAELQIVEESHATPGMPEDSVVLLVHSGSRGYGGDILRRYTSDGTVSLPQDSPQAIRYLEEHDRACSWARLNRDLIALRFLECLEPGTADWHLGASSSSSNLDTAPPSSETLLAARTLISERKIVDLWHNNVSRTLWPPLDPSLNLPSTPHSQETCYIHRKGAAPTHDPHTHHPLSLLPLPGSRGTPTIILRPTFSAATGWGLRNGLSLAHGAGRAMSRAKAAGVMERKYKGRAEELLQPVRIRRECGKQEREGLEMEQVLERRRRRDVGGSWVVCEDRRLVWEEAPEAYKDVYEVLGDLVREGVAEGVGWCRPVVSYKMREERRGR
ncbi:MAG: hypothetical protein M1817_004151 [Caeruleum heppii]|nr:MAG: hypothetical protein M1817_004151 [Caeruleum heppii]